MDYLWLKAVHVAAVLIFSGGLFAQALGVSAGLAGGTQTARSIYRWDQRFTVPAMLAVWLSGAIVASSGSWFASSWLWAKLVIVVGLSGMHGVQSGRLRRLFNQSGSEPNASPVLNPAAIALSLTAIAILVVTKPF